MEKVATTAPGAAEKLALFSDFAISTVYMMGFSFIAGSAVTVLSLLLLDYMRDAREAREGKK
jgi:hypothetical protein